MDRFDQPLAALNRTWRAGLHLCSMSGMLGPPPLLRRFVRFDEYPIPKDPSDLASSHAGIFRPRGRLGGSVRDCSRPGYYSISNEYFTRLKFSQFHYADFGLPPRVFVAEIGFLATWWVGFVAAWFIARITVPAFPQAVAFRHNIRGFLIIFVFAFAAAIVGFLVSLLHGSDYSAWEDLTSTLGVSDLPSFVRVAYIHNASYLGGLIGLVAAILYVRKLKNTAQVDGGEPPSHPSAGH